MVRKDAADERAKTLGKSVAENDGEEIYKEDAHRGYDGTIDHAVTAAIEPMFAKAYPLAHVDDGMGQTLRIAKDKVENPSEEKDENRKMEGEVKRKMEGDICGYGIHEMENELMISALPFGKNLIWHGATCHFLPVSARLCGRKRHRDHGSWRHRG